MKKILICGALGLVMIATHLTIDKWLVNRKIESILNGKNIIWDYEYTTPTFKRKTLHLFSKADYISQLKANLGATPDFPLNDSVIAIDNYVNIITKESDLLSFIYHRKFKDYYYNESGGLSFYTLIKTLNGFDIIETKSSNFAYLVSESIYNPIFNVWVPSNRPNIDEIHSSTIQSLEEARSNGSRIRNSKNEILRIPNQRSFFYRMTNIEPSDTNEIGGSNHRYKQWNTTDNSDNLNQFFNPYTYKVKNNLFVVWLRDNGAHYELMPSYIMIVSAFIMYSTLLYLITKLIKYFRKSTN